MVLRGLETPDKAWSPRFLVLNNEFWLIFYTKMWKVSAEERQMSLCISICHCGIIQENSTVKTILSCSAQKMNFIYFKPSFEVRSSGFSVLVFSKRRMNVTFFLLWVFDGEKEHTSESKVTVVNFDFNFKAQLKLQTAGLKKTVFQREREMLPFKTWKTILRALV